MIIQSSQMPGHSRSLEWEVIFDSGKRVLRAFMKHPLGSRCRHACANSAAIHSKRPLVTLVLLHSILCSGLCLPILMRLLRTYASLDTVNGMKGIDHKFMSSLGYRDIKCFI